MDAKQVHMDGVSTKKKWMEQWHRLFREAIDFPPQRKATWTRATNMYKFTVIYSGTLDSRGNTDTNILNLDKQAM